MSILLEQLRMNGLVIASHNAGKLHEISELLQPLGITVYSAAELNLPEPEETGTTFTANAELKARAAAEKAKRPALADDSGLAVEVLNGAPGIYSARWAGPKKDFRAAMERVRSELEAASIPPSRWQAAFICVLALALPDGVTHSFEGRVEGMLAFPPRGTHGFGYDPIFIPAGETRTFGEMPPREKHRISHRARAFAKLMDMLRKQHPRTVSTPAVADGAQ